MLNKLAAGLIAAALFAAPVVGSLAVATPAAAATTAKVAKTKIVKAHRQHLRQFRIVQCYMTGSQARHVRLHTAKRFQRVACYLPAQVRQAKVHVRNHVRHVTKQIKHIKQARHIKTIKTGRTG